MNLGVQAARDWCAQQGVPLPHPGAAIIPKAIGLNPSRTIAALAEHIGAGIVAKL